MRDPSGASWWKRTSCSWIAENTFTGMFTSPKLIAPVQIERGMTTLRCVASAWFSLDGRRSSVARLLRWCDGSRSAADRSRGGARRAVRRRPLGIRRHEEALGELACVRRAKRRPPRSSRRRAARRTRRGRSTSSSGAIRCWSNASCFGAASCSRRRIGRCRGSRTSCATRRRGSATRWRRRRRRRWRCSERTPPRHTARRSLPRCRQRASTRKPRASCNRVGSRARSAARPASPTPGSSPIAPTAKSKGASPAGPRCEQAGDASVTCPPRTRGS